MPEIELPPGKYRWRRPLSKPLALVYVAGGLAGIGWLWWTRTGTSAEILLTAFVGICVGILAAELLRNVD